MEVHYKLAVIGAGPGGYEAALRAAELGCTTVLVEAGELGGTCLNRGCIPTKSLLHSALIYQEVRQAGEYGIDNTLRGINLERIYEKKEQAVETLKKGIESMLLKEKVTIIKGRARDVREGSFVVETSEGEVTVTAEHILLATGSQPLKLPIEGAELKGVITSDEILEAPLHFTKLVIIGGGVIGTEFAGLFNALGCEVTILEAAGRILSLLDRELSQGMTASMKKKGINIRTGVTVKKIEKQMKGLLVVYEDKSELLSETADTVLLAVGRKANTKGLFAPVEVEVTNKGRICVNDKFETLLPHVYAIGDVVWFNNGQNAPQLAHTAAAQGIAVVEAICGQEITSDLTVIPSCVYTDPEIASVGMSKEEIEAAALETVTGKYLMLANGKTVLSGGERGFIKLIFEKKTKKLLAAQLMCERATDMIGELTSAIVNEMTWEQLVKGVRPHPTFNEGIKEAAKNAHF